MEKLVLIDAYGYLHRAYHALPPLTTSKGEPVNALYGFIRMIFKLLNDHQPDRMAVCFDAPGPTFRDEIFTEYKATRKETDSELKSQLPISRDIAAAMGLASFELSGYEADDILATLARAGREKGMEVIIVSGDKDVLQVVQESIKVLNEPKQILFDPAKVREVWGVEPEKMVDVLALMGDSTDNIPGVEGVGEKTAVKLVQEHGSVEELIRNPRGLSEKLKEKILKASELIRKSKKLVILKSDVPVKTDWEALKVRPFDQSKLLPLLQRLEFQGLIRDLYAKGSFVTETRHAEDASKNYRTILSRSELEKIVSDLKKSKKFAFDVETTGLRTRQCDLVGLSFSWGEGRAAYVPVGHRTLQSTKQMAKSEALELLRPVLEDPKIKKAGHNLKFDSSVLLACGVEVNGLYFDTMVASYCLDPSRPSHGLKDLASVFLERNMTRIEELLPPGTKKGPGGYFPMDLVEIEKASPYACADADSAFLLMEKLDPLLDEKDLKKLFYELEMPLVEILADMETEGIKIDPDYLNKLGSEFSADIRRIETEAFKLAGEEFNLNSSKQLSFILFEKLKLPQIRKTKTGFSTDEDVLRKLSASHELPALLIKHRELSKLKSTYIDGLLSELDPGSKRVHTSFNQTGAVTGRLSSSDPNLQNIPIRTEQGRRIRRAFIPEAGSLFLSADYSQIDLRVLAHLSGDPALNKAFSQAGDIHRATAAEVFQVGPDEVTGEQRNRAKAINFGMVYGQQAFGLSQQLGITTHEAQQMINNYFERYSGVRTWIDTVKKDARAKGYVKTLLGRIRYLPEIHSKNAFMRAFAERTATNTPVQGTSADIIKAAMIRVARALKSKRLSAKMLVQVHDDLLLEVPEGELEATAKLVKLEMESALKLSVPLVADLAVGKNWAEMEKK